MCAHSMAANHVYFNCSKVRFRKSFWCFVVRLNCMIKRWLFDLLLNDSDDVKSVFVYRRCQEATATEPNKWEKFKCGFRIAQKWQTNFAFNIKIALLRTIRSAYTIVDAIGSALGRCRRTQPHHEWFKFSDIQWTVSNGVARINFAHNIHNKQWTLPTKW